MTKVSIVIPARDEQETLDDVLGDVFKTIARIPDHEFEVICVDDHSKDRTPEIIRAHGATLVQNTGNSGKGLALRAGFAHATGDIIVMMDADYSHRAEDLPVFLEAFRDEIGLVIGSRVWGGSEEYTHVRALGNVFLSSMLGLCTRRYLSDALNGYKAFRREVFTDFTYTAKAFEIEIELIANALRRGYRVVEVSSRERARAGGEMKSSVIRHGTRFLARIFWEGFKGVNPPTAEADPTEPPETRRMSPARTSWYTALLGVGALVASLPLALLIGWINTRFGADPERAAQLAALVLVGIVAVPLGAYLAARRRAAAPSFLALATLSALAIELTAIQLFSVSHFVALPADILSWSEGEFVADILKFRVGHPLYSDPMNNESFIYPPGSQLLTYLLAWIGGHATSIPAYRVVQLLDVLAATLLALDCVVLLVRASGRSSRVGAWWGVALAPLLYLVATNRLTNEFVRNLHNDALAQLLHVSAYWILLRYLLARDRRWLLAMAILPALGFMTKQSLAIWAVLYPFHLAFFDRPRSLLRATCLGAVAFGLIGLCVLGGYRLWGEPFLYWLFGVMGGKGVSPLRAVEHLLQVWPYLAMGLLGGAVLMRGEAVRLLAGPWLVWLALMLASIYTSGIAWMLNHIGPASLLAAIWGLAALASVWPRDDEVPGGSTAPEAWLRPAAAAVAVFLSLQGLGVVMLPLRRLPEDALRYVREIEREFEGQRPETVLLDAGSWPYLQEGVVMRDRLAPAGDRGFVEASALADMVQRLDDRYYAKILVRHLHSPDLHYDSDLWPTSSGVRAAMLRNYREVRRIPAVARTPREFGSYFLGEISVLERKSE